MKEQENKNTKMDHAASNPNEKQENNRQEAGLPPHSTQNTDDENGEGDKTDTKEMEEINKGQRG
jgi:hypothetical protein